ncbi:hypothetical protein Aperf_G00000000180 [Anoplocephala perfoliata]
MAEHGKALTDLNSVSSRCEASHPTDWFFIVLGHVLSAGSLAEKNSLKLKLVQTDMKKDRNSGGKRSSMKSGPQVRMLCYFASIKQIAFSEVSRQEGRRYQIKLILSNDPVGEQPIIFTFDSKLTADTVIHTLEGYCKLSPDMRENSSTTEGASLLVNGCPFRTHMPLSAYDQLGKSTQNHQQTLLRSHITLERVLGEGQFGDVYKGTYRPPEAGSSMVSVAVKACKVGLGTEEKQRWLEEADLHGKLNHPHIIKLYGVCRDEPVWLVLEFAGEGEVFLANRGFITFAEFIGDIKSELIWYNKDHDGFRLDSLHRLHRVLLYGDIPTLASTATNVDDVVLSTLLRHYLIERQGRIELSTLVTYCHQLSSSLAYLEALKIIHRDVAARNVLVANESCVKLADFGMARQLAQGEDFYIAEQGRKVPIKWMAPESLKSRIFSSASDVWMFGVCMWEILSYGLKPFHNLSNAEAVAAIGRGERLARPDICLVSHYRLMLECWMDDPLLRPTFNTLQPKLREISTEAKRLSAEAEESHPQRRSANGPTNSLKQPVTNDRKMPEKSTNAQHSEAVTPVHRATYRVVEQILAITKRSELPSTDQLLNSVKKVGEHIRTLFILIQHSVEDIDDVSLLAKTGHARQSRVIRFWSDGDSRAFHQIPYSDLRKKWAAVVRSYPHSCICISEVGRRRDAEVSQSHCPAPARD